MCLNAADNWNVTDQAWMQRWIDAHMAVARSMGKVGGASQEL